MSPGLYRIPYRERILLTRVSRLADLLSKVHVQPS